MAGPNKVSNQQKSSLQPLEQSGTDIDLAARKERYKNAQEQLKQSHAAFNALLAEYQSLVNSADPNKQKNQQDYINHVTAEVNNISKEVPDVTELKSIDQADMLLRTYARLSNMIGAVSKELQANIEKEKQAQLEVVSQSTPAPQAIPAIPAQNVGAATPVTITTTPPSTDERAVAKNNFKNACKTFMATREETLGIINNIPQPQASTALNGELATIFNNYYSFLERVIPGIKTKTPSSSDFNEWTNTVTQLTTEMSTVREQANNMLQQSVAATTPLQTARSDSALPAGVSPTTPVPAAPVTSSTPSELSLEEAQKQFAQSQAAIFNARRELLATLRQIPRTQKRSEFIEQQTRIIKTYYGLLEDVKSRQPASSRDYVRWDKFVNQHSNQLQALNIQAQQFLSAQTAVPVLVQAKSDEAASMPNPATPSPTSSPTITSPLPVGIKETPLPDSTNSTDLPLRAPNLRGGFEKPRPQKRQPTKKTTASLPEGEELKDRLRAFSQELSIVRVTITDLENKLATLSKSENVDYRQLEQLKSSYSALKFQQADLQRKVDTFEDQNTSTQANWLRELDTLVKSLGSSTETLKNNISALENAPQNVLAENLQSYDAQWRKKAHEEVHSAYDRLSEAVNQYQSLLESSINSNTVANNLSILTGQQRKILEALEKFDTDYDNEQVSQVMDMRRKLLRDINTLTERLTNSVSQLQSENQSSQQTAQPTPVAPSETIDTLLADFMRNDKNQATGPEVSSPTSTHRGSQGAIDLSELDDLFSAENMGTAKGEQSAEDDLDDLYVELQQGKNAQPRPAATELVALNARVQEALNDFNTAITAYTEFHTSRNETPPTIINDSKNQVTEWLEEFNQNQQKHPEKITTEKVTSLIHNINQLTWIYNDALKSAQKKGQQATSSQQNLSAAPGGEASQRKQLNQMQISDEELEQLLEGIPDRSDIGRQSTAVGASDSTNRDSQSSSSSPQSAAHRDGESDITPGPHNDEAIAELEEFLDELNKSSSPLPQQQPLLPTQLTPHPLNQVRTNRALEKTASSGIGAIVPNWIKNAWNKLTSFLPTIRRAEANDAGQRRGSSEMGQGSISKSPPAAAGDLEKSLDKLSGTKPPESLSAKSNTSTDARLYRDLGSVDASAFAQRGSQSPPPSRPVSGIPVIPFPPPGSAASSPRSSGSFSLDDSSQPGSAPSSPPSSPRSSRSYSSPDISPSSSRRGSLDSNDTSAASSSRERSDSNNSAESQDSRGGPKRP